MPQFFRRRFGVAATFNFTLFKIDGVDFRTDAVHATGDTKIMKDEGAETDTDNGFVDEGQTYSLLATATEMEAARIVIPIVDLTGPKAWLDDALIIETEGNKAAQHDMWNVGALLDTTIAARTNQTIFTISEAPDDNEALLNASCLFIQNTSLDFSFRDVTAYSQATKQVTVESGPDHTTVNGQRVLFFQTGRVATAVENALALLDLIDAIETGITPRGALRVMLAAAAGPSTGHENSAPKYLAPTGGKERIAATTDEHGNRIEVTRDVT